MFGNVRDALFGTATITNGSGNTVTELSGVNLCLKYQVVVGTVKFLIMHVCAGKMKQLVLEHNKIYCYQIVLRENMTDMNQKMMVTHVRYGGLTYLIIASKHGKRVDLTYCDLRRDTYCFHHSYKPFSKSAFLAAVKLLISDIVEGTTGGRDEKSDKSTKLSN